MPNLTVEARAGARPPFVSVHEQVFALVPGSDFSRGARSHSTSPRFGGFASARGVAKRPQVGHGRYRQRIDVATAKGLGHGRTEHLVEKELQPSSRRCASQAAWWRSAAASLAAIRASISSAWAP